MRKFKLIKEYPGSPKLGTVLTPKVDKGNDNTNNFYWEGSWFNPNEFTEYWEEVKESDYQIISFTASMWGKGTLATQLPNGEYSINSEAMNGWSLKEMLMLGNSVKNGMIQIHSVKRLSDGEIFTIGDRAKTITSKGSHDIRQFVIRQRCTGTDANGDYIYDGIDAMWINWEENCGGNWLDSTEKVKQPIFLTHDGKDIFEGDRVIWVKKDSLSHDTFTASAEVKFHSDLNAYFISAVDAQNYINKNTPIFTTQDGVGIKKDEIVYVVDGALTSIDMISNFVPQDYPTRKAFSNSKAAEDYIVENRYALSIKDFWEFDSWGGSDIAKYKRLKRLVKERIGIK